MAFNVSKTCSNTTDMEIWNVMYEVMIKLEVQTFFKHYSNKTERQETYIFEVLNKDDPS